MDTIVHTVNIHLPVVLNDEVVRSAKSIAFNPVFWNIVAQIEFRYGVLTKIMGSPYRGCYVLAAAIFILGIVRDWFFKEALATQPVAPLLDATWIRAVGVALFAIGNVLVLSSMWALGLTGTYLGDYFGILMDHKVESFPFNVASDPMYLGSYLSFMGTSLYYGKAIGLLLGALVWLMYVLALKFEEPFTTRIYAERDALRQANGGSSASASEQESATKKRE